jgi:hypothetical protein
VEPDLEKLLAITVVALDAPGGGETDISVGAEGRVVTALEVRLIWEFT